MAQESEQHKNLLSAVVGKHMKILGSQIALDMAGRVPGVVFDQDGKLASLDGDARLVFKNLIDEYMLLSEPIVHTALCNLVSAYPEIQNWYNQDLGRGRLQCPYFLKPSVDIKNANPK